MPGHIGTMDVADVHLATKTTLSLAPTFGCLVDEARVGILGGSHGGFFGAHALGQHPELYSVGILRNPVINLCSIVSTSDIPDWAYVEAFGCDAYLEALSSTAAAPTPERLRGFYDCSPIRYASAIKAPVLFTLGLKDKRVPASQGLELHNVLKNQGCITRVLAYPEDCHAIDKPASEADAWVNFVLWFRTHFIPTTP